VVGDSVWDLAARRAGAFGVELVGRIRQKRIGERESNRIYNDPADLLLHLDEMGGRREG
jgi:phosphoglycolate phosphatase-like HAD superfamily hydrolase